MGTALKPTLALFLILSKQGQPVHRSEAMISEAKNGEQSSEVLSLRFILTDGARAD